MTKRSFPIVRGRRADFGPFEAMARIVCARCGTKDEVAIGDRNVGEWIGKKFEAGGWVVGANENRDLCPACSGRPEKREDLPMVVTNPGPRHARPAAEAPDERSPAAIAARRMAFDFLGEYLDPATRRYRDGWSDEKVAAESKISIKAVEALRKEFFFDLAPPPEDPVKTIADGLDRDLAALRGAVEAIGYGLKAVAAALEVAHKAEQRLLAAETALLGRASGLRKLSDGRVG